MEAVTTAVRGAFWYCPMTSRHSERWGDHVAKELGDGLLVYLGWPDAREDDPERAVRAGLAVVDAMQALNDGQATERVAPHSVQKRRSARLSWSQ